MPFNIQAPELILILVVVLIVFGVGRISKVSRELGSSVREFRKGLKGDEETGKEETETAKEETNTPS